MREEKKPVKWPEIIEKIRLSGYKTSYVTSQLYISRQYLYQMLNGKRYMPDGVKERFEVLFNCEFARPTPPPEILPHEKLEAAKQSLKDKPLFKYDNPD